MTTTELIKTICRIEDLSDAEISHRIAAAKEDMKRAGLPVFALRAKAPPLSIAFARISTASLKTMI